jgi:glutamate-1-semialdehyde 2,1-aminomutase
MKSYGKSKALYDRACQSLAGGVSSEFRKFNQPHPLFYSHGYGSHGVDVDGNKFLDFTLSQEPSILGHYNIALMMKLLRVNPFWCRA